MNRTEYPRPEFSRERWQCLNGEWDFLFEGESEYQKIEVPFVFQSPLSGIGENRQCDRMTYRRSFTVPADWQGDRIRLHFGAVDYSCRVYINDCFAGANEGGGCGFFLDITEFLNWQEEKIRVHVYDPLNCETIPRGKQSWTGSSESIWYTPSSGIWQTVFLEPVPEAAFEEIRFTPDIDQGTVLIEFKVSHPEQVGQAVFEISMEGEQIAGITLTGVSDKNKLSVDLFKNKIFKGMTHDGGWCWSPENPKLFDVKAYLYGEALLDRVDSYFGMRKIHTQDGIIYLNNRPYYQRLILDQGYWKDGLLTAPADEDFVKDIRMAKEMGFNGCRKHQKAEDPRFLYHADHIGFLVWSEIPSAPSYDTDSAMLVAKEWMRAVSRDYNHPSIVAWVTMNESWGVPGIAVDKQQQAHTQALYHMVYSWDRTRLIVGNDGWEMTQTDICAIHNYSHGENDDLLTAKMFEESFQTYEGILHLNPGGRSVYADGYQYGGEPVMLTEFGGISIQKEREKGNWGYTVAKGAEEFLQTYERILQNVLRSPILCGFCYTQLSDVEQETNGLLTYEREYKIDPKLIKRINEGFHYPLIARR